MIRCGWCGMPTEPSRCSSCGRDPSLPYRQRGREIPTVARHPNGRPPLDQHAISHEYAMARDALLSEGKSPTVEAIADRLDRSPRTIREWRRKFGL